MDHIDKKLILALWFNCRISYRNLGAYLGMSGASAKKRVDRLLKSGTIHDFYIVLGEAMLDMKRAIVLVRTNPTVSVNDFSNLLSHHPEIFRILNLINGDFLLVTMYPKNQGYQKLESFIHTLDGVNDVIVYPIYRSENCILKGKKGELSPVHLKVLSCLVINARMSPSEISKQLRLSSRRVEDAIDELQKRRNVIFSVRWKPNMGRGLNFMLRITYDRTKIDVLPFNQSIAEEFPSEFWYSYLPENMNELFSIFLVENISDAYKITEVAKNIEYVESVETMIYYSAKVLDPPTRVKLIEILQQDGYLADYSPVVSLELDLIV